MTSPNSPSPVSNSKATRLIISLLLIATFPIALFLTFEAIENQPEPVTPSEKSIAPQIDVISVTPSSETVRVEVFGEARPRYVLAMPAEVAGIVESVSPHFKSGNHVKQSESLAKLKDLDYRQVLATAEQGLAQASLELLQAQREAQQAQDEWQQSGQQGQPDSPLVLREPYVAVAEAQVKQAQLAVDQARAELAKTNIAPHFDAWVQATSLAPGQYVQPGEIIATLYDTTQIEIRLPISESQWALLPDRKTLIDSAWPVTLTSVGIASTAASSASAGESDSETRDPLKPTQRWTGYVARVEQHIETATRQRALVVIVEQSEDTQRLLLPGTFVKATLEGKRYENVWRVPASSLSRTGDIWFIDTDNQLQRCKVNVLFEHQGNLFVENPAHQNINGEAMLLVAVKPLVTYFVGQLVEPKLPGQQHSIVASSRGQTAQLLLGVQ